MVALLLVQHGQIHNLFDEVRASEGDHRRAAFHRLVRLLAVHETAEEEVVHPFARAAFDGGAEVVDERLAEEKDAKEMLRSLEDMDTEDAKFLPVLTAFRESMLRHARAEERYEFTQLRRHVTPQRLAAMALAVRAAEKLAPTHSHPGVEGVAKNIALGPVAALVDRTRDALREALRTSG
ncbi:hemerythrin domain-containing protein [Streptomyces sp. NPDC006733]|uniref:hemerythrin domain-containing protein n=1 Tax=Streptomyces sp. NPDC006733 TaxID=3155460 RepID=UPI0033E72C25